MDVPAANLNTRVKITMKKQIKLPILLALILPCSALADTFQWDTVTGDASVTDGPGTWSTGAGNWYDQDIAQFDQVWVDGGFAAFGAGNGAAGTVSLGSPITAAGLTFNPPGSGNYIIAGNNLTLAGAAPLALNVNATISSGLAGTGGFTMSGSGTLTLGATSGASTLSGPVIVNGGTLAIGAPDTLPATTVLILGDTSGANLNLGANSQTVAVFAAGTNVANTTGTISISSGQSLTVAGSGTCFMIGGTNGTSGVTTKLTVSGAGSLIVNSPGGGVAIGNVGRNATTFDMSALGTFTADLGTSGNFKAGTTYGGTGLSASSTLTLATNSTITANTLAIDVSGGNTAFSKLLLGAGVNTLNVNTINVGVGNFRQNPATMIFATNSGTVKIRGADGASPANLSIGIRRVLALTDTVDFTGHAADLSLDLLDVGGAKFTAGTGLVGLFSFDTGTAAINSIRIGSLQAALASSGASGTVNISGGVVTISTAVTIATNFVATATTTISGTLNITNGTVTIGANAAGNSIIMASGAGNNNATVNLIGGTVTLGGNIIKGGSAAGDVASITLNGAVLDMQGHNIGGTPVINTLNLLSGTLKNVAEINNGGSITKSGAGTLILDGSNAYTGGTTISVGTLLVNGTAASSAMSISSGATLGGTGTVGGTVTLNSGGFVTAGTNGGVGTLSVGALSTSGGGTLTLDLANVTTVGGTANDLVAVAGNLTLSGVTTLLINPLNGVLAFGDYTLLTCGGTLTGTSANFTLVGYNFAAQGQSGAISVSGGTVKLTVSPVAGALVTWVGDGTLNVWDINTSANWANPSPGAKYHQGDNVTFNDSGSNIPGISLAGALTPGSVTVANTNKNYTFAGSGILGGTNGLTKSGPGQLTIVNTGPNTYTAATTINGGTVQIGSGGTVGNLGPGNIIDNSLLVVNRSDNLILANVISGSGGVQKSGANTLTLSAQNTYSGTTTISAGTLAFGSSGSVTLAGDITGGGLLAKTGSGLLTVAGTNETYLGGTLISGGTLQVGNGGLTGSLSTGDVTNNAALVFDLGGSTTLLNAVSGSGTLGLTGSGTMTLAADNYTCSGGTLISSGTLQLGDGASNGSVGTGAVTNNSALVFRISGGASNTNKITGSGSVACIGSGFESLTLSGALTYAGPTTVLESTLQIGSTLPPLSALVLGDTNGTAVGNLDLSAGGLSQAVSSLSVGGKTFPSTITLGSAQTLTVNGSVNIGNTANSTTVNFSVGGADSSLVVNTNGGTIQLGLQVGGANTAPNTLTTDLSQLGAFIVDLGATGNLLQGEVNGETGVGSPINALILAATNSISAGTITLGPGGKFQDIQMNLGSVTNVLNCGTLNLGTGPRNHGAQVQFNTPGSGSLRVRGYAGGTSRANVNVGTGNQSTTGAGLNVFDVTGHYSDLLLGTLTVGDQPSRAGAWSQTFSFDQGKLDATSLVISKGCRAGISGTSIVNLGGGTVILGSVTVSSSSAAGTLNISGGNVAVTGNIVKTSSGVATLNVANATLTAAAIGNPGIPLDSMSLNNVALNLSFNTRGNPTSAPVQATTFSADGSCPITFNGIGLTVGQFPLIAYSGGIGGSGFAAFSLVAPPGFTAVLVDNSANQTVDILIQTEPPPPVLGHIAPAGPSSFNLTGSGAPNEPYYVFASTNVALPLIDWWLIGTTNSDAGGLIRYLDHQATNDQRYYRFGR